MANLSRLSCILKFLFLFEILVAISDLRSRQGTCSEFPSMYHKDSFLLFPQLCIFTNIPCKPKVLLVE